MTKRGRNLSVAERTHLQKLSMKHEYWLISKKFVDKWVLVSRATGKEKEIKAP